MAQNRINAPQNGVVVRGLYYPGGKFVPKEGRLPYAADLTQPDREDFDDDFDEDEDYNPREGLYDPKSGLTPLQHYWNKYQDRYRKWARDELWGENHFIEPSPEAIERRAFIYAKNEAKDDYGYEQPAIGKPQPEVIQPDDPRMENIKKMPYEATAPSGSNTFVPGGIGRKKDYAGDFPTLTGATGVRGSGRPHQKIGFAAPFGLSYNAGVSRSYNRTPRTVTINHPDRDLSKKKYVDPDAKYAATYCSNLRVTE